MGACAPGVVGGLRLAVGGRRLAARPAPALRLLEVSIRVFCLSGRTRTVRKSQGRRVSILDDEDRLRGEVMEACAGLRDALPGIS